MTYFILQNLPTSAGRFRNTFTEEQMLNLKQYVEDLDKRAFGVTKEQFARITFNYAETLNIPHRFNRGKKKAGKDFIQAFMSKFKFSLRKPEATSAARLAAFNKINVAAFFNLYKEILSSKAFKPHQIYNVDETGCSTVPTKTPNVLSPTGNRRVVKVSSAERGTNVSVACCFSAAGNYVPPFFIFPRIRMQQHFLNNAPNGSIAACNESGWMTAGTFIQWLEHFIKNVRPSDENPILLLMDNHSSHVTLQAVNLCRGHNITILGFPPHTSHRMQPLDVAFYGPFKTAYSRACNDFMMEHPGQTIAIKDVAGLFNVAYSKVATVHIAEKGFKATGLFPFNSQIFSDLDFEPSMVTDQVNAVGENVDGNKEEEPTRIPTENRSSELLPEIEKAGSCNVQTKHQSKATPIRVGKNTNPFAINNPPEANDSSDAENSVPQPGPSSKVDTPGLPPLPASAPKVRKQRAKLPSLHISSTPVKKALEKKEADKQAKERKKEENSNKKARLQIEKTDNNRSAGQKNKKNVDEKKGVIFLNFESSSDSSVSVIYAEEDNDDESDVEELCLICNEYGKTETWYICSVCRKWAHAKCTGLTRAEARENPYICDFCV